MHGKIYEQKIDSEGIINWAKTLNSKNTICEAINKNSANVLEKIIKNKKISDFYPLFFYALMHDRENIIKYLLENKREHLKEVYNSSSPFLVVASNTDSKCLPLLLEYGFQPVSDHDKYIVSKGMQECTPSGDCIYKLFKMICLLAEAALNVEAGNINIYSKEDTEQKVDKVLSDIPKDILLYHFGSYYENLFECGSFAEHKYAEIMQIIHAFPIFNWIIGAVSYRDIYLVGEPILLQTMKCHQMLNTVKSGGNVNILGWGEPMHALKCMSALVHMLEAPNDDDVQDKIIKYSNSHICLDKNTVEKLIGCDRKLTVNCLKERIRALRWLCGFHKKYIHC